MRKPKVDIYKEADKRVLELKKYTAAEFNGLTRLAHFDEVNVIRINRAVNGVYRRVNRRAKRCFEDIAWAAIEEGIYELEEEKPKKPDAEEIVDEQLRAYNPITKYVYNNEIIRKAARCREAIVATTGNQALRPVLARELKYLLLQEQQYGDCVTDAARTETFAENGVKRVMWITQRDDRVCEECLALNGLIFPIDQIPPKPHYACRCFVVGVED